MKATLEGALEIGSTLVGSDFSCKCYTRIYRPTRDKHSSQRSLTEREGSVQLTSVY